ncbi:hypothetical protein ACBJ59_47240 [Nonomuraea sp. MTCD27]|uniref:hypothetical protein n=1 Tax=Nonomuraea sp. MTCD27 TaxID=1676747 RepID=UPI0035C11FF6
MGSPQERENGTGDAPFAPFGPGPAGGAPYGMGGSPRSGPPNGGGPAGGGPADGGPAGRRPAGGDPAGGNLGGAFNGGGPAGGAFNGGGSTGGPFNGDGPAGGGPAGPFNGGSFNDGPFNGGSFDGGAPMSGAPGDGGPSRGRRGRGGSHAGGPPAPGTFGDDPFAAGPAGGQRPGGPPGDGSFGGGSFGAGPAGGPSGGAPSGGGPSGGRPSGGGPSGGRDPFGGGDAFGGGGGAFGGAPSGDGPGSGAPGAGDPSDDGPATGKSRRSRKERKGKDKEASADDGSTKEDAAGDTTRAPQSKVGWSPYDEGKRSRAPLWAALSGIAVLGLLGGGLALMWNTDDPVTAETTAARQTSAPLPSPPPGKYGYAAERSTDPDPISVKEVFGSKKKLSVSGRSYEMTITSKDKKCTDGALGDALHKALKAAKCTQFVRASFRDKDGKVIGTVGVANLSSSKQASKVAKAGDTKNYVKPLAGKDTVTKFLGSGSGGAKISTYGHYAILYWFQNKDGTKPDSKGSKRISEAINDITKATLFLALDNRALTGSRLG